MINIIEKIKRLDNKIVIVISLVASLQFCYNLAKPLFQDNIIVRFNTLVLRVNELEEQVKMQGQAIDGEYDLNKNIFKKYHLHLYHSNKNKDNQIKNSYLKYEGKNYKAWVDPTSLFWCYRDGHNVKYIKELSH